MIRREDLITVRAFGLYKNKAGYYKREDLDKMLSGAPSLVAEAASKLKV